MGVVINMCKTTCLYSRAPPALPFRPCRGPPALPFSYSLSGQALLYSYNTVQYCTNTVSPRCVLHRVAVEVFQSRTAHFTLHRTDRTALGLKTGAHAVRGTEIILDFLRHVGIHQPGFPCPPRPPLAFELNSHWTWKHHQMQAIVSS